MKAERFGPGQPQYHIRDIEGDMGEPVKMDLLVEEDGDVIVVLKNLQEGQQLEIQFCTPQGGARHAGIAKGFREIAKLLYEEANPQAELKDKD